MGVVSGFARTRTVFGSRRMAAMHWAVIPGRARLHDATGRYYRRSCFNNDFAETAQ